MRCPTCDSPDPKRHPAMQFEGEVQVCPDPFHPITAETVTDEQIDALWREACGPDGSHLWANPDLMHMCTVATNRRGDFTTDEQAKARAGCAEILNARSK